MRRFTRLTNGFSKKVDNLQASAPGGVAVMNLPKIAFCKDCKKKPKEIIWAMGYSDKDDELYLVHWCNAQNKKIHFPELKKHPFTANYVNGQRPQVREAWNALNVQEVLPLA